MGIIQSFLGTGNPDISIIRQENIRLIEHLNSLEGEMNKRTDLFHDQIQRLMIILDQVRRSSEISQFDGFVDQIWESLCFSLGIESGSLLVLREASWQSIRERGHANPQRILALSQDGIFLTALGSFRGYHHRLPDPFFPLPKEGNNAPELICPFRIAGMPLGALVVEKHIGGIFSEEDELTIAQTMTSVLGLYLSPISEENNRLLSFTGQHPPEPTVPLPPFPALPESPRPDRPGVLLAEKAVIMGIEPFFRARNHEAGHEFPQQVLQFVSPMVSASGGLLLQKTRETVFFVFPATLTALPDIAGQAFQCAEQIHRRFGEFLQAPDEAVLPRLSGLGVELMLDEIRHQKMAGGLFPLLATFAERLWEPRNSLLQAGTLVVAGSVADCLPAGIADHGDEHTMQKFLMGSTPFQVYQWRFRAPESWLQEESDERLKGLFDRVRPRRLAKGLTLDPQFPAQRPLFSPTGNAFPWATTLVLPSIGSHLCADRNEPVSSMTASARTALLLPFPQTVSARTVGETQEISSEPRLRHPVSELPPAFSGLGKDAVSAFREASSRWELPVIPRDRPDHLGIIQKRQVSLAEAEEVCSHCFLPATPSEETGIAVPITPPAPQPPATSLAAMSADKNPSKQIPGTLSSEPRTTPNAGASFGQKSEQPFAVLTREDRTTAWSIHVPEMVDPEESPSEDIYIAILEVDDENGESSPQGPSEPLAASALSGSVQDDQVLPGTGCIDPGTPPPAEDLFDFFLIEFSTLRLHFELTESDQNSLDIAGTTIWQGLLPSILERIEAHAGTNTEVADRVLTTHFFSESTNAAPEQASLACVLEIQELVRQCFRKGEKETCLFRVSGAISHREFMCTRQDHIDPRLQVIEQNLRLTEQLSRQSNPQEILIATLCPDGLSQVIEPADKQATLSLTSDPGVFALALPSSR